ncbi:hypothetical protein AB9P05_15270 [Roseivirga sp. BDSF3-8]|uniref:hypothetical protein n=1 Tax=Roseivirga sp. BDSF3-8 TaxID=3241598 RepID=UPI003531F0BF
MSDLYSISHNPGQADFTVEVIPDLQASLHFRWRGFLAGESYRHALRKLLEAILKHNILYVLHDYSHIRVIHPSDQLWFKNEFIPLLNQSSIRHSFMVRPKDEMADVCIMCMGRKSDLLIAHPIKIFGDYRSAFNALKNEARIIQGVNGKVRKK